MDFNRKILEMADCYQKMEQHGSWFKEREASNSEGFKREIVKRFRALLKLNGITPPPGEPTFQIKRNAAGKIRLEVTFE